jgi:hypothetical protein
MLHNLGHKPLRTNKPNKVKTFLKGRSNGNGTIYDYAAPVDIYGNPSLYYQNVNVYTNQLISNFSYPGYWNVSSKYCFGNPSYSYAGLYLNTSLADSPTNYNITFMCRFYLNEYSDVNINGSPASTLFWNGNFYTGGFGLFIDIDNLNLVTSYNTYSFGPKLSLYTWYSVAITITNYYGYYSYFNAFFDNQKFDLGYNYEESLYNYYNSFSIMSAAYADEYSGTNLYFPLNGYMTDMMFVNDVVSDNILYGFIFGSSIL